MSKNSLMLPIFVLVFCLLACSSAENRKNNSKTDISTPRQNSVAPEGYMNVNGVIFSDEENIEMMNKVDKKKTRRNLSDKDALILSDKMWDEFLTKKRKQHEANSK
jgi:hypothetical protein